MPLSYVCHLRRFKTVLEGQLLLGLGPAKVAVVAPSQPSTSAEEWSLWYLMGVQIAHCCPQPDASVVWVSPVTTQTPSKAALHLVPYGAVSASAVQKSEGLSVKPQRRKGLLTLRETSGNGDNGVVVVS